MDLRLARHEIGGCRRAGGDHRLERPLVGGNPARRLEHLMRSRERLMSRTAPLRVAPISPLASIAADLPDPARTDLVSINLACALGYLDWPQLVEWRDRFPFIADGLDRFAAAEPAFAATDRPKETS